MCQYQATIVRVVDGDTVVAGVDLRFTIRQQMELRLAHLNAPEHTKGMGRMATECLKILLSEVGRDLPAVA